MRAIQEDIQSQSFKPVYLLYGEEEYLKQQYKKKLLEALLPAGDTMNLQIFGEENFSLDAMIDYADTMPFLAERRVILLDKCKCMESKKESKEKENKAKETKERDRFREYLPEMPSSTVLVIVEDKVDRKLGRYKTIAELGHAAEFAVQSEEMLTKWILSVLKKENRKITGDTMRLFLEKTGTDMTNISEELEKLLCYTMGREVISSEDVETICTVRTSDRVFAMIDAIAAHDQKKALDLYYDLLALKKPPIVIRLLMMRQFNTLMRVKELKRLGVNQRQIPEKAGIPPFTVDKYVSQAARFQEKELRGALEECIAFDEEVKTGRMDDVMSVEILIRKYSSQNYENK